MVIEEPSLDASVGVGDGGTSRGLRGRANKLRGDSKALSESGSCSSTSRTLFVLSGMIAIDGMGAVSAW